MINTFSQFKFLIPLVLVGAVGGLVSICLMQQTMKINELAWCAYQCDKHGYPETIVYNGLTRKVSCLCADGLELTGSAPSKEFEDGYGTSDKDLQ